MLECRRWIQMVALGVCAICASVAEAEDRSATCGSLKNHYGPYDYRTSTNREIVEDVHFTPKVESLRGGNTSMTAGGDMNYTLRVFPNHHRALMALIRLAEKEKTNKPRDMEYTVECWFDRGERFRPDDAMVKALHGIYLIRTLKPQEGAERLQAALELAGDDANIHYNLGLAFFDLRQFDKSLESAHRAYALGFPLPGLREKLKRVGKWQEPATATVPPIAPARGATAQDRAVPRKAPTQ